MKKKTPKTKEPGKPLSDSDGKVISEGCVHVFGLGVRAITQITLESNYLLQNMQKVFHCEDDSRVTEYLADIGCPEVNLGYLYQEGRKRERVYQEICDLIIETAKTGVKCAYLAPGNPAFLNSIAFKLQEATARNRIPFFMYPGVSSIDSLLTDLRDSVEVTGFQCFEATQFTRLKPAVDKRVPLFLFQPGAVDAFDVGSGTRVNLRGVKLLQDTLIKLYGRKATWIVVKSAMSIEENPVISTGDMDGLLERADELKLGTLVIPGVLGQATDVNS